MTLTTVTGRPAKSGHSVIRVSAARAWADPSSASTTGPIRSSRATRTAHGAWSTTSAETDPSSADSQTTVTAMADDDEVGRHRPRFLDDQAGGPTAQQDRFDRRGRRGPIGVRVRPPRGRPDRRAASPLRSRARSDVAASDQGTPRISARLGATLTIRTRPPSCHGSAATRSSARSAEAEPSTASRMRITDLLRGQPCAFRRPTGMSPTA